MDNRAEGILSLIRYHESSGAVKGQGVESAYDVVWGGINSSDRPQNKVGKHLTEMTVDEVLAWQDSIDRRYNSEAAGAYQILEDTLRDLVTGGAAKPTDPFDVRTQDKLAFALLMRRGWDDFVAGEMTAIEYGNSLAREWASFPVHTRQRGHRRFVEPGQSYYAGDGLNKAYVPCEDVIAALDISTSDRARIAELEAIIDAIRELVT